jgi:hypothetical protein
VAPRRPKAHQLDYTLASPEQGVPVKKTIAYETFDRSISKWIYISMSSDGDYGTSYSDGWHGDTKIYGPAAGSTRRWRLVATKLSDDEFTENIETATNNQKWLQQVSLRCRRIS